MDFNDFLKTTGAGGDTLARQAWERAVDLVKAAIPDRVAEIDAALAPLPPAVETVVIAAGDVGNAGDVVGG